MCAPGLLVKERMARPYRKKIIIIFAMTVVKPLICENLARSFTMKVQDINHYPYHKPATGPTAHRVANLNRANSDREE